MRPGQEVVLEAPTAEELRHKLAFYGHHCEVVDGTVPAPKKVESLVAKLVKTVNPVPNRDPVEEALFPCPHCPTKFAKPRGLALHLRNAHFQLYPGVDPYSTDIRPWDALAEGKAEPVDDVDDQTDEADEADEADEEFSALTSSTSTPAEIAVVDYLLLHGTSRRKQLLEFLAEQGIEQEQAVEAIESLQEAGKIQPEGRWGLSLCR